MAFYCFYLICAFVEGGGVGCKLAFGGLDLAYGGKSIHTPYD